MDASGIDTILFIVLAFFTGLVASILDEELKIIMLLITGFMLSLFAKTINFIPEDNLLLFVGFLAFSLYIFEFVPKLKYSKTDLETKIASYYLINSFIATIVSSYVVYLLVESTQYSLFYAFIFGIAMLVTQLNYHGRERKNKTMHVLNLESNASIVFSLSLLFAFFDIKKLVSAGYYLMLFENALLSIGIGLISAIILLRFASKMRHHNIISFGIVIITFFAAQRIAMPGITLLIAAVVFSKFSTQRTKHTFDFFKKINNFTEIIVIVLAGFVFSEFYSRIDAKFILLCLTIFAVFFFMRFFASSFFAVSWKERVFITLNNPKGVIGALIYLLLHLTMPRYEYLWAIFFMQIVLSEITSYLSHSLENPEYL